jgi:hypothetical protein
MEKNIVSLMCKNIKKQGINLNEMLENDCEKTIDFIHSAYINAQKEHICKSTHVN